MALEGSEISKGIGTGEAQVFKPYQSPYAGIASKRKKAEDERMKEIFKLTALDKIDIFIKQQTLFGEKQQEIKDYVLKNVDALRKGDPQATMGIQELVANYKNDAEISKGIKEDFTNTFNQVYQNQEKYDAEEAFDYLNSFTGYDDNKQLVGLDKSKISQKFDLQKDFEDNLLNSLQEMKEKGKTVWTNPDGSVGTLEREEFTATQAKGLAAQRLTNENIFRQANKDWKKEDPQGAKYADVNEWYKKKFLDPYVKRAEFGTRTEGDKEGKGKGWTFSGNKMQNDKVAVSYYYNPQKDTEIFTFDDIKTPENKILTFNTMEGETVQGTPLKYEQKSGGTPELTVAVKDEDGIITNQEVDYLQASDKIKNNYGFNPFEIKEGLKLRGVSIRGGTKEQKSATKQYDVKGKPYSSSAIEKAAKASGMTIDEYVKEANK